MENFDSSIIEPIEMRMVKPSPFEVRHKIDKKSFRPNEVHYLKGDARKSLRTLNFKPKFTFNELVKDMIKNDLKLAEKELI